jgi:hypothetical protein
MEIQLKSPTLLVQANAKGKAKPRKINLPKGTTVTYYRRDDGDRYTHTIRYIRNGIIYETQKWTAKEDKEIGDLDVVGDITNRHYLFVKTKNCRDKVRLLAKQFDLVIVRISDSKVTICRPFTWGPEHSDKFEKAAKDLLIRVKR